MYLKYLAHIHMHSLPSQVLILQKRIQFKPELKKKTFLKYQKKNQIKECGNKMNKPKNKKKMK